MKRTITLLAAIYLFATGTIKAQDSMVYKSFFGDETTMWYGMNEIYDYFSNETISICGDTIIDGLNYKTICINNDILGFLREDISTGTLFGRYMDYDNNIYIETIIADLSLNIGDTTILYTLNYGYDSIPYVVFDKYTDSNGINIILHKISISGRFDEVIFIEGIGSKLLFAYGFDIGNTVNSDIYCCEKDGINVYKKTIVGEVEDCRRLSIGISEAELSNEISLYPNPAKDKLFITDLTAEEHTIQIISPIGAMIKTIKTLGPEVEIDLNGLPNGVYNIRISNRNGSTTKKIIKL